MIGLITCCRIRVDENDFNASYNISSDESADVFAVLFRFRSIGFFNGFTRESEATTVTKHIEQSSQVILSIV